MKEIKNNKRRVDDLLYIFQPWISNESSGPSFRTVSLYLICCQLLYNMVDSWQQNRQKRQSRIIRRNRLTEKIESYCRNFRSNASYDEGKSARRPRLFLKIRKIEIWNTRARQQRKEKKMRGQRGGARAATKSQKRLMHMRMMAASLAARSTYLIVNSYGILAACLAFVYNKIMKFLRNSRRRSSEKLRRKRSSRSLRLLRSRRIPVFEIEEVIIKQQRICNSHEGTLSGPRIIRGLYHCWLEWSLFRNISEKVSLKSAVTEATASEKSPCLWDRQCACCCAYILIYSIHHNHIPWLILNGDWVTNPNHPGAIS